MSPGNDENQESYNEKLDLDANICTYFHFCQDYVQTQVKLCKALKQANFTLSRARNSSSHSDLSSIQIPTHDLQATLRVSGDSCCNTTHSTVSKLKNTNNNPLSWFGFLNSAHLLKTQQDFVTVVHIACRLASLQGEIKRLKSHLSKQRSPATHQKQ